MLVTSPFIVGLEPSPLVSFAEFAVALCHSAVDLCGMVCPSTYLLSLWLMCGKYTTERNDGSRIVQREFAL